MASEPNGGLMDRNVPSQLDEEDLRAEIEIELPGSQYEENVLPFEGDSSV